MAHPLLLITLGLPGSGKSALAQKLSAQFQFVKLTADAIRVAIIPQPRWDMAEHRFFFGILDTLSELLLNAGQSVILDANHNQRFVRHDKYDMAAKLHANIAVLYVHVPTDTLKARTAQRQLNGHTDTIPADKLNIDPAMLLARMQRSFEPPRADEPVIRVAGDIPADQQVKLVLSELAEQGVKLAPKSTKRPQLTLMLGLPGSGKTTIATEIARQTGAIHVSSDAFRLAMFPKPTFDQSEHDLLYRTLDYITELLLASGVDVIYDANLNRFEHRADKYAICKKYGARTRLIWVQTDRALAQARRVADSHDGLRPPFESPEAMFARIASIFEAPDGHTEPFTSVDGAHISAAYIAQQLQLP